MNRKILDLYKNKIPIDIISLGRTDIPVSVFYCHVIIFYTIIIDFNSYHFLLYCRQRSRYHSTDMVPLQIVHMKTYI